MPVDIPFRRDMNVEYGAAVEMSPLVRRVVARNPSMFTFKGTGTYILGRGRVAVIDPGPDMAEHVDALLNAIRGESVAAILLTHTHIDHSPAARALKAATGAKTYGFGPHGGADGDKVEEGGDLDFRPDVPTKEGDVVSGPGWTVEALHTPGHTSNHLCFGLREEKTLFTGDHVMGWSTTVISPPDGDMRAYMASLRKLLGREDRLYVPTHGVPIPEPKQYASLLIEHRLEREGEILKALAAGHETIPAMVGLIYAAVDKRLHGAAGRSVLAHLRHMVEEGRVVADGQPTTGARYRLPR
jgi:glyoxylase-like metal-dependent hydrolase (beta-lactamase superfamily II)